MYSIFSDHHWVLFNISSSSSMHQLEEIAYRKIKLISADAFAGDIHELDCLDVGKLDLEFAKDFHHVIPIF